MSAAVIAEREKEGGGGISQRRPRRRHPRSAVKFVVAPGDDAHVSNMIERLVAYGRRMWSPMFRPFQP
jgi:hypothetical protein